MYTFSLKLKTLITVHQSCNVFNSSQTGQPHEQKFGGTVDALVQSFLIYLCQLYIYKVHIYFTGQVDSRSQLKAIYTW